MDAGGNDVASLVWVKPGMTVLKRPMHALKRPMRIRNALARHAPQVRSKSRTQLPRAIFPISASPYCRSRICPISA